MDYNYNRFLYLVVNQFTLDEFKRFTNFREMMQHAMLKLEGKSRSVDYYIKKNFQQNIPVEKHWKRKGFLPLKLTSDFYASDTAARIFHTVFGIKKCTVNLVNKLVGSGASVVVGKFNFFFLIFTA